MALQLTSEPDAVSQARENYGGASSLSAVVLIVGSTSGIHVEAIITSQLHFELC